MAVIFYGLRDYGRVDEYAGEHASTRFFHVYFVPLFPTGSSWTTPPRADGTSASSIKLYGKSVAAGYLRIWGPIAAVANLGAAFSKGFALGHLVVGLVMGTLAAWSFTWTKLRGAAAIRRSDFNYVAFGTRCEPHRMNGVERVAIKRRLDQKWNERSPKYSPNEIAQHGTSDAMEAVLAHGLLRLASVERGAAGASDGADADRILAGRYDAPAAGDGPYRADAPKPVDDATASQLAKLVEQRAAETNQAAARFAPPPEDDLKKRRRRSRLYGAGLVFLTLAAVGGVMAFVVQLGPAKDVGLKELRSTKPPRGMVRVTCERIDPPLWEEADSKNRVTAKIAMCKLGKYLLPVRYDDPLEGLVVEGDLRDVESRLLWVRDGLRHEPELEAQTLDVYVDVKRGGDIAGGIIGLGIAVATPVLWIWWFRARRRRKAEERALVAKPLTSS